MNSSHALPVDNTDFLIDDLVVPSILSALPFDIGAQASNVFHVIPFSSIKSIRSPDVKQVALSDIILTNGPQIDMISFLMKSMTT